jgi:hypothetical protein
MGEGRGPPGRGTAASRRLPLLIGALVVVLLVTLLTFQWPTPACHNARRRGGGSGLLQALNGFGPTGGPCGREPHVNVSWIESPEGLVGGKHSCAEFQKVCLDQGALVTYDEQYNRNNGSELPTLPFNVTLMKVCP